MAILQISVGDDLKARAEARAVESGYSSAEQYLEALLRADLDANGPADEELEQLLLRRLDSGPVIEVTPDFAEQFRREIRERRTNPGGGK